MMIKLTLLCLCLMVLDSYCVKESKEEKEKEKEESTECVDFETHPNWRLIDQGTPCGLSTELDDRIMGGEDAALGEFPWMARVFFQKVGQAASGGCGGSIINNRYVLTAAHCCSGVMDSELAFIRIGDYDNGTKEDCYKGHCAPAAQNFEIDQIIPHEAYFPMTISNDICLLRTKKPIIFSEYVRPVCLPSSCEMQKLDVGGKKLTLAGWGVIDTDTGRELDILQKITLTGVDSKKCRKEWSTSSFEYDDDMATVENSQICAGTEVGEDACPGDSGGPLMYKAAVDGPSRSFLVGLVSYGLPCSPKESKIIPGVYTRVSSYLNWVLDSITEFSV